MKQFRFAAFRDGSMGKEVVSDHVSLWGLQIPIRRPQARRQAIAQVVEVTSIPTTRQ